MHTANGRVKPDLAILMIRLKPSGILYLTSNMILKLSLKELLKPLFRLLMTAMLLAAVLYFYAGGYDGTLLPGFIIILCIPVLPTTYLCIEYYLTTRNQTVEIAAESVCICYKDGRSEKYSVNEIKEIKLYKSAGMEKGSFPYQTAEMYYHAELMLNDGGKIILASILGPNFDDAIDLLKGVNKRVIRTIYSTIYI
ncbi:hypothetical protein [Mucilaginibacter agri]|uniref:PH domain-containing protein n=1 Tax=Mucilaginibacter agri TaxID=2695265 RepID=A0A965ZGD2_9SPHI|nr:hypothetical protein [Mucilaginibacter agri]NCD69256.1 hypothetical protein [Mucilaginibacter agri]